MLSAGAVLLLAAFAVLLVMGVPIAVALGLSGVVVVITQNLGIASLPTNLWTGIAKYPLLALPVFIAAGMVFERSGVAERLVRFMSALVGQRAGGLALVAMLSVEQVATYFVSSWPYMPLPAGGRGGGGGRTVGRWDGRR
jgi:TRAP-type mannitol/chloroaromatic compound transport system permease large subunit